MVPRWEASARMVTGHRPGRGLLPAGDTQAAGRQTKRPPCRMKDLRDYHVHSLSSPTWHHNQWVFSYCTCRLGISFTEATRRWPIDCFICHVAYHNPCSNTYSVQWLPAGRHRSLLLFGSDIFAFFIFFMLFFFSTAVGTAGSDQTITILITNNSTACSQRAKKRSAALIGYFELELLYRSNALFWTRGALCFCCGDSFIHVFEFFFFFFSLSVSLFSGAAVNYPCVVIPTVGKRQSFANEARLPPSTTP